jgi:hypothetical protein
LSEEKVKYQYDNDKPEEHYTPKINIGEKIQVNFNCCFDSDTVEMYLNDSLIETVVYNTNESNNYAENWIFKFDMNTKDN